MDRILRHCNTYSSMAIAAVFVSFFLTFEFSFVASNEVNKSSENKMILQFVQVTVMPKLKRDTKNPVQFPVKSKLNNATRVFRRSKIRKKIPRRYAKYRHSTRVIRGKPAIVLLPPFYKRPVVQNFTVRPPAMMEHPAPVPVAPIDMPTPVPEPLVLPKFPQQDTTVKEISSAVNNFAVQSSTQQSTTETYTEHTTGSYYAISTTPSFEYRTQRERDELVRLSIGLQPPNIPYRDNGLTVMTYNTSDIMYEQPPSSPVQYLLPPLWPEFDDVSINSADQLRSNDYGNVNNKDANLLFSQVGDDYVTTPTTALETGTAYSELEVLKPPIFDNNFYWTNYQNDSYYYNTELNNDITSQGNNYNSYQNPNMTYVDVNLSLLSTDVASTGMKVEATAKALEMAMDMMKNQGVPAASEATKQRREDSDLPLAVAESGYFGLQNGQYSLSTQPTYSKPKKPKQYKKTPDEVIPGVAGQDYPIYATPPPPKHRNPCTEGFGYIPDPSTRCQVFYVCTGVGMGEPMLCPNGTLFSKDFLVCDWWYNVECLAN